jgi:hypothetical protein
MEGSSTGADAATVTRWFQIADPFGTYIGLAGCSARLGVWTVYGQDNGKPLVSGPCLASWQGGGSRPLVDSRIFPTQKCIRWILPRMAIKDAGLASCCALSGRFSGDVARIGQACSPAHS